MSPACKDCKYVSLATLCRGGTEKRIAILFNGSREGMTKGEAMIDAVLTEEILIESIKTGNYVCLHGFDLTNTFAKFISDGGAAE